MIELGILIGLLLLLDIAALLGGRDSRDGQDWTLHQPSGWS